MNTRISAFPARNYSNHRKPEPAPAPNGSPDIKSMRLNVSSIKMADYQRKPNEARVMKIVHNFDPHRDRPIECSYRNGAFWCFDGQHRLRAYAIMGRETIAAHVHYGLSYQDEANLFARQHENEQHVSVRDRWEAAVKSGDKNADVQAIIRLCEQFGFAISTAHCAKTKANTFGCVRELQSIYAKHGPNGFKTLLFVLSSAWGGLPSNTHRDIVAGIGKLMDSFPLKDQDWNRLRDKLSAISPEVFLQRATSAQGRGGKRAAICMVEMHNSGLARDSARRLNAYKLH